jgi:hypothetical protein
MSVSRAFHGVIPAEYLFPTFVHRRTAPTWAGRA